MSDDELMKASVFSVILSAILTTGVSLVLLGLGANWLTTIGNAILFFTVLFIAGIARSVR